MNDDDINIIVSIVISILSVYEKLQDEAFINSFHNKLNWLFDLEIMHSLQVRLFRGVILESQNYLKLTKPFLKGVRNFINVFET